jgi:glycosyltransferase involved in cell wall biosynthesis
MATVSPICVLGMHRSGTSLITGILKILGVYLGPDGHLMKPRNDNPKGFWENQLLTDIDDEILSRFGGTWDRPPTFPDGWETSPILDDLRQKALAVIDDDFGDAKLWGWKDPRACLLLPFWQQLIPNMQYVICLRNPVDVALSLEQRDGFTIDRSLNLWLQYTATSLKSSSGKPRSIIFYDEVLEKAEHVKRLLCKVTGNNFPPQDTLKEINAFIDHDLRHHHTSLNRMIDNSPLTPPTKALYLGLSLCARMTEHYANPTTDEGIDLGAVLDNLAICALEAHWHAEMAEKLRESEAEMCELRALAIERDDSIAKLNEQISANARYAAGLKDLTAKQDEALKERDDSIAKLNEQISENTQHAAALKNLTAKQEDTLTRIYQSHGWKALLAYYSVRNLIFPPGSRRKFLAQRLFNAKLNPKAKQSGNKTLNGYYLPLMLAQNDGTHSPNSPRNIAACTIVSKNYIAFARTLAESFHRFHPETPFFVLLVDRIDGYFDPRHEPFHLVTVEELNIPHFDRFCFKYNIVELNTAVKPYFLSYLFAKHHLNKLIYLDPDILITGTLSELYGLLNEHSIVLVPHLTSSIEDNYLPTELSILQAGTYNLGFIGLANNPELPLFLKWWEKRVYDGCFMAPEKGMHVDQKWIDLVPGIFDRVFVLKHPGYDVAYWNLHSRSIGFLNDQVVVNGGPCYFFHFSGFDPADVAKISKHQNRFSMKDIGDGYRLFRKYSELVHAHGHHDARSWPYAFGYFDNGVRIPDIARRMYHSASKDQRPFGNPFSTDLKNNFFNWLKGPAYGRQTTSILINRLWNEIYWTRTDLQKAFPDIFGTDNLAFSRWIMTSGIYEHQIDTSLVVQVKKDTVHPHTERTKVPLALRLYVSYLARLEASVKMPLKRIIGRNERVWTALKKMRNRMIYGQEPPMKATRPNLPIATPREFGVNLAGYLRSEKGVGEAGRAAVRALEAASIPFALNDIVDSGSINAEEGSIKFSEDNPYSVNLVHINADQIPNFASQKGESYFKGRYNIGCWFWELSQFPEDWYSSFDFFNELWAPTSFIQDALSRVSPIPVVKMPLALSPKLEVIEHLTRADFGLPEDSFIVLAILDFASVMERKNPIGLIEAFRLAFGTKNEATLILKVAHSEQYPSEAEALKRACATNNVRIIDRILSRQEMNTLLYLCDCYASLHRSEGYGLPIAEAMTLGKPVVVTAYSGNMDFTNPANSFLVKYKLTEIDRDYGSYRKGWVWADPDLDHAAELMRSVYENTDLTTAIGNRARENIQQLLHPKVVAQQLRERLVRIGVAVGTDCLKG